MTPARLPKSPCGQEADRRSSTPSCLYDERYFLTACEGYERFGSEADAVSPRLATALRLVQPEPGERILDIGCGRGETLLYCAGSGAEVWGIDYSIDALRLARRVLDVETLEIRERICLSGADAKQLPFQESWFDKLLMFDLVEHLYPWELAVALREAWRVLVPGGQLIIHTAPNQWYYQFGYPLYRLFERMRGKRLPADPRERFPFHHLHVNEQNVLRLRHSLLNAGFEPRVWLDNVASPLHDTSSPVLQLLVRILLGVYPFRWIFRNDIFAIAYKRE